MGTGSSARLVVAVTGRNNASSPASDVSAFMMYQSRSVALNRAAFLYRWYNSKPLT